MTKIKEEDYRNMYMRLYLQKASIYENWHKLDSAYKYVSRGRIAQKHFFLDRMDEQIFEMNAKFELQQKESKITEEKLLKEKEQANNFYLVLIVIALILVIIVTLITLYLKRKTNIQNIKITEYEKQLLQTRIDNKNKELSNAIAYANTYNNSLEKIKSAILNKTQNEAISTVNIAINNDYNWLSFFTSFSELKPNFFDNFSNSIK